jgi:inward rectifier potassium channel
VAETTATQRYISKEGRSNLVKVGLQRALFSDLYHFWLASSWRRVYAVVIALYLLINALFACAYLAFGGVENARAGSFGDAFFFSVETLTTIGYGRMVPVSLAAHLLVTFEAFCGIIGVALITGLMVTKFARPTARVLWSDVCVVAMQDGVPSLMLRVANARGNQVVEAQLRVGLMRSERTIEGEMVRRMHDLRLVRASSAVFALSWLAVHPIDEKSVLRGQTTESLREMGAELYVSLTGLDETFNQTIHSRHSYNSEEISWGRRFVDIVGALPDGRVGIDYTRFHDTKPAPLDPPRAG